MPGSIQQGPMNEGFSAEVDAPVSLVAESNDQMLNHILRTGCASGPINDDSNVIFNAMIAIR